MNLKNKMIGGRSVTIKRVPARNARHIQTLLMSLLAEPLSKVLNQEVGKGVNAVQLVADSVGDLVSKLNSDDLDKLIDSCQEFILIDGMQFDENEHFDASTLADMYEVLFFFMRSTFEPFIADVLSRLQDAKAVTSKK